MSCNFQKSGLKQRARAKVGGDITGRPQRVQRRNSPNETLC
jgi:hypothetical protein